MSLSGAEIPGKEAGREALPNVTRLNRGLYLVALSVLGAALLLLIVGWILLAALGRAVPDQIPVVTATIVGGFVGVIAADGGGRGQKP